MKAALCVSGVVLSFASLWIGAWAVGVFGIGHWAAFPTVVTAILLGLLGVFMCVAPFMETKEGSNAQ